MDFLKICQIGFYFELYMVIMRNYLYFLTDLNLHGYNKTTDVLYKTPSHFTKFAKKKILMFLYESKK